MRLSERLGRHVELGIIEGNVPPHGHSWTETLLEQVVSCGRARIQIFLHNHSDYRANCNFITSYRARTIRRVECPSKIFAKIAEVSIAFCAICRQNRPSWRPSFSGL